MPNLKQKIREMFEKDFDTFEDAVKITYPVIWKDGFKDIKTFIDQVVDLVLEEAKGCVGEKFDEWITASEANGFNGDAARKRKKEMLLTLTNSDKMKL